jgi:RHS repeat-associated protein
LVEVGDPPEVEIDLDTWQFLAAMEYRYDAGRQRYMVRPRDAETLAPPLDGSGDYDLDIGAWHDYSGAAIYGDYAVEAVWDGQHQTVTSATVTETLAHEPGMVQYDRAAAAGEEQLFLHGNLVGTTERITDSQSAIVHRAVYTAFGEPIFPSPSQGEGQGEGTIPTRYGYVGAWGYEGNPLSTGQALEGPGGLCDPAGPEAHCDPVALLGWLHVGERYYDPAGGRFMQRDPIGIAGALNVYTYISNAPLVAIDPTGLSFLSPEGPLLLTKRELDILRRVEQRIPRSPFTPFYQRARDSIYLRHIIRARGCGVVLAATAGAIAGRAIDNGIGKVNNGFRISDGAADLIYGWIFDDGSGYDPWGI